jgi:P27 family predicted phage terminase small subunit
MDGADLPETPSLGMGMRGRKPTPTVLKLLNGNPGKRPINANEPIPEPLPTDCPPELTASDAIKEWHERIVPAITRNQITSADRVFAIAHCELWATWRSQLADAARHAHVIASGKSGHPMPNPARGMANKTFLILAKVDAELGLTPTSRSRVHAPETTPVEVSKWAGVLK